MAARRQHAHKTQDIFKTSYNEIIKSAKRKHSDEFYIFKTVIGVEEWYSECSVDISNSSIEHWKKKGGRWKIIN